MNSDLSSRITIDPKKCGGRPCIRSYRLRVEDVLQLLHDGAGYDDIVAQHPFLEIDDIRACVAFVVHQLKSSEDTPEMLSALDEGIKSLREEETREYTRDQLRQKVREWASRPIPPT